MLKSYILLPTRKKFKTEYWKQFLPLNVMLTQNIPVLCIKKITVHIAQLPRNWNLFFTKYVNKD
jgi:hypothetical protein